MKNLFKFGFLALALSVSLTACWDTETKDKNKQDSLPIDSPKVDTAKIDTAKTPLDTAKNAEKK